MRHDKNTPSELPSGTNTQDSLEELNEAMWFETDQYKRMKGIEDAADEATLAGLGAGGADPAADSANGAGPAALAALAATAIRQEEVEGGGIADEVPDGWCFPYLLLTAAYSPWSGQAPSEWKHLDSSDGPPRGKKHSGEVTIDVDNPVCSPATMSRVNANGDSSSRRQHAAAVKREQDAENKAASDKELQATRKEALETKKKGLAALEAANTHVQGIGENMKRMVELSEQEAASTKRQRKIAALKDRIALSLGNQQENRENLGRLLDEV